MNAGMTALHDMCVLLQMSGRFGDGFVLENERALALQHFSAVFVLLAQSKSGHATRDTDGGRYMEA